MSFIDFPDVPLMPGIPNVRRSIFGVAAQSGVLAKVLSNDVFGVLTEALMPRWGIYDQNGRVVLPVDSVVAFEYRGESRLSGYPLEQGAFSTYNKVQMPYDIRMRVTCGGDGQMGRSPFLATLEYLKASLALNTVVTPDTAYTGANLTNYDYQRTSRNGVTLLTVDLMFQEVRETATAVYSSTTKPSGADTVGTGAVQTSTPTASEQSTYSAKDRIAKLEAAVGKENVTVLP